MKLVDLIVELEKKKEQFSSLKDPAHGAGFSLNPTALKIIEKRLFECDEFKNVVRINFIEAPTYIVDEETGEPISSNREFLGGQTSIKTILNYRLNPGQEIKFGKIVDLYIISSNKRYILKEEITKPGIWIYPTTYDEKTFQPTNQIRVIWDPEQLQDALRLVGKPETSKQRLMRMFETALDNMESNLPCEHVLTIRCSSRSVLNPEDVSMPEVVMSEEKHEGIPIGGLTAITGATSFFGSTN